MMDTEYLKKTAYLFLILTAGAMWLPSIVSSFISKYLSFLGGIILSFISLFLVLVIVFLAAKKIIFGSFGI